MRDVTVTNISHYRRPYKVPYKVIVQQISPSSLLQRMVEVTAVLSVPCPEPQPAYASVIPIDCFPARRIR
jgi:hypothetical protein